MLLPDLMLLPEFEEVLKHFFRFWFGKCVKPDDGSLIGAETCCLHRCKFVQ
jgi:hypothetical protein